MHSVNKCRKCGTARRSGDTGCNENTAGRSVRVGPVRRANRREQDCSWSPAFRSSRFLHLHKRRPIGDGNIRVRHQLKAAVNVGIRRQNGVRRQALRQWRWAQGAAILQTSHAPRGDLWRRGGDSGRWRRPRARIGLFRGVGAELQARELKRRGAPGRWLRPSSRTAFRLRRRLPGGRRRMPDRIVRAFGPRFQAEHSDQHCSASQAHRLLLKKGPHAAARNCFMR